MKRSFDVGPGRDRVAGQGMAGAAGQAGIAIDSGKMAVARGKHRAGPCDHCNRDELGQGLPILPMVEVFEAVAAHDPDKLRVRAMRAQQFYQVDCIGQMRVGFDIADLHGAVARGHDLHGGEAGLILTRWGLERIARRWKPPDLIKAKMFQRRLSDVHMAGVRGIKAAAKQANLLASSRRWEVGGAA